MTTKPIFSSVNRRQFMTLAGSATAALAAPAVLGSTPARAEDPITIFTWETYHEDPWIAEWSKATGIPVKVVRTGSVDEMFAQTQSGAIQADIIYIDSGSLKRYNDAKLIAPLDVSKIANAGNVTAGLKYPERNSIDGKLLGLPYNWGTQPLMFDESVVTSGTDSWGVLWDTKYKGKVNLFDDAYITFPMVALYVGAKDAYNLTDAEFDECKKALKALRPQVRTIARGFSDAEALYASGDATLGYCQNISIVFNLQNKGKKFNYSFPKEGTPTWIDNAVLTERGQRDSVYRFINDNLTPAWQARFINFSLNNGVLTEDSAKAAGMTDEIIKKTNIADQASADFWPKMSVLLPPENIDKRLEIWNDFKAGTL